MNYKLRYFIFLCITISATLAGVFIFQALIEFIRTGRVEIPSKFLLESIVVLCGVLMGSFLYSYTYVAYAANPISIKLAYENEEDKDFVMKTIDKVLISRDFKRKNKILWSDTITRYEMGNKYYDWLVTPVNTEIYEKYIIVNGPAVCVHTLERKLKKYTCS